MRLGILDIGSNSVRLMLWENGETPEKKIIVSGLGKNLAAGGMLDAAAKERTKKAIDSLIAYGEERGAEKFYAFGTAAMRKAADGKAFAAEITAETDMPVEIIGGEEEAAVGLLGALGGKDGGIVDIGGASTEITVCSAGRCVYSHSLDLGTVSLADLCGQSFPAARAVCAERVKEYGKVPAAEFYGIGGTATSLAAVAQELEPYDPARVNGYVLDKKELCAMKDRLYSMSVEERKSLKGLQPERAEVIAGGSALLLAVMEHLGIENIRVSESDNLEGYALSRFGNGEHR